MVALWAAVSTAAFLWVAMGPTGPSRATIWDSDSWLLAQLDWSTGSASAALTAYLATHNATYSEAAMNWSIQSWDTVRYGQTYGLGGFPTASALNITTQTFGCTYYALLEIHSYLDYVSGAWTDPGVGAYTGYLTSASRTFYNLSASLRGAGAGTGTDPLVQLGSGRVASIRQNTSALFTLSQPWGAVVSGSDCGG